MLLLEKQKIVFSVQEFDYHFYVVYKIRRVVLKLLKFKPIIMLRDDEESAILNVNYRLALLLNMTTTPSKKLSRQRPQKLVALFRSKAKASRISVCE